MKDPEKLTIEDLNKVTDEYCPVTFNSRRGSNRVTDPAQIQAVDNPIPAITESLRVHGLRPYDASEIGAELHKRIDSQLAKQIKINWLEWTTATIAAAIGITYALLLELWK